MPRSPSEGTRYGGRPLSLTAYVECPDCEADTLARWAVDVADVEQLDEAPVGSQACEECGAEFEAQAPIWTLTGEAG